MIAAVLLAAACQCQHPPIDWREVERAIDEALHETDRRIALERERRELEEIVRRTRACFELATDGRLSTDERHALLAICKRLSAEAEAPQAPKSP